MEIETLAKLSPLALVALISGNVSWDLGNREALYKLASETTLTAASVESDIETLRTLVAKNALADESLKQELRRAIARIARLERAASDAP